MSRPVKVNGELYDALRESAFQNRITIQEALQRRLEHEAPPVPVCAPHGVETQPHEGDTGQDWLSLLMIGAIVALGAFLIARFFGRPDGAEAQKDPEQGPDSGAYPYSHTYGYPR